MGDLHKQCARGSILDADPPAQGVNIPRRSTVMVIGPRRPGTARVRGPRRSHAARGCRCTRDAWDHVASRRHSSLGGPSTSYTRADRSRSVIGTIGWRSAETLEPAYPIRAEHLEGPGRYRHRAFAITVQLCHQASERCPDRLGDVVPARAIASYEADAHLCLIPRGRLGRAVRRGDPPRLGIADAQHSIPVGGQQLLGSGLIGVVDRGDGLERRQRQHDPGAPGEAIDAQLPLLGDQRSTEPALGTVDPCGPRSPRRGRRAPAPSRR
jgi:hypothetical protein